MVCKHDLPFHRLSYHFADGFLFFCRKEGDGERAQSFSDARSRGSWFPLYSTELIINDSVLYTGNLLEGGSSVRCSYHTKNNKNYNNGDGKNLWEKKDMLRLWWWWWLPGCVLILKHIELYTINMYSFSYVTYTSIHGLTKSKPVLTIFLATTYIGHFT